MPSVQRKAGGLHRNVPDSAATLVMPVDVIREVNFLDAASLGTTTGLSSTPFSIASYPSVACPHTLHPACDCSNQQSSLLIRSLSSTIKIRTKILVLLR
jgi:hypothetical protein